MDIKLKGGSNNMVDKTKIEIGKVYTYKELCQLFNEKNSSGDSKKAQLKQWESWFSWEHPINPKTKKPSKKFKITNIYSEQQEIEDKRKYNVPVVKQESTFKEKQELSTTILMTLLLNAEVKEQVTKEEEQWNICYYKADDFYEVVGLCNSNYSLLKRTKHLYTDIIPLQYSREALNKIRGKMQSSCLTALSQMKSIVNFTYTKSYVIKTLDEDGREHKQTITCSDLELGIIEKAISETIEEWNTDESHKVKLVRYRDVFNKLTPFEIKMFDEKLTNRLKKKLHPSFSHFFSCYKLMYVTDNIVRELIDRGIFKDRRDYTYWRKDIAKMLNDTEKYSTIINKKTEEVRLVNAKFVGYLDDWVTKPLLELNEKLSALHQLERKTYGKKVGEKQLLTQMEEAQSKKKSVSKMVSMVVDQSEEAMSKTQQEVDIIKKRDEEETRKYVNNRKEYIKQNK